MIHILFVPGMFGSTIEGVIRSFTAEYENMEPVIKPDGSMHSFEKQAHPTSLEDIEQMLGSNPPSSLIVTPIYPMERATVDDIIHCLKTYMTDNDHLIVLRAENLEYAELNMLFQYRKIIGGSFNTIAIFCGNNKSPINRWNENYQNYSDMQLWELREWISIFYEEWLQSCQTDKNQGLSITNKDMLVDTKSTLLKIIDYCGLTLNKPIDDFAAKWQRAQQYILDEYSLVKKIVDSSINNEDFTWRGEDLCIISEALVQNHLRRRGYEIKCFELNDFPTDSKTLYNLLEKC